MPVKHPDTPETAVEIGETFRLHTTRCGKILEAQCRVYTHELGWELRLEIAGSLQRSQVCVTRDDVLETSERWRAALVENRWC